MAHLFIAGMGYSGQILAQQALALGWQVSATNRTGQQVPGLEQVPTCAFSRQATLPAQALDGVTHFLSSVPPDEEGDPVVSLLGARLQKLKLDWIGYLSTTGIYGDRAGAWVTEDTLPTPRALRSDRRLMAENAWRALDVGCHVFRLPGIYGPGRSAIDQLRNGTAKRILKPDHVFCRIHVADLAQGLLASMQHPNPGQIYNLADDLPAPNSDVVEAAAKLMGMPPPPAIPWEQAKQYLSPMALSFWSDCKRVSSQKLKDHTGWQPRYPSYHEGLAQILTG